MSEAGEWVPLHLIQVRSMHSRGPNYAYMGALTARHSARTLTAAGPLLDQSDSPAAEARPEPQPISTPILFCLNAQVLYK